jgi:protein involved in sex pheromone biosynthesis
MSRKLLLAPICAAIFLSACGEKSEAEKADEERAGIREERRKKAIEIYRQIAKEYPDDPRAAEAQQHAAALEAQAPKK